MQLREIKHKNKSQKYLKSAAVFIKLIHPAGHLVRDTDFSSCPAVYKVLAPPLPTELILYGWWFTPTCLNVPHKWQPIISNYRKADKSEPEINVLKQ